jgi:signal transduction histidine kinase
LNTEGRLPDIAVSLRRELARRIALGGFFYPLVVVVFSLQSEFGTRRPVWWFAIALSLIGLVRTMLGRRVANSARAAAGRTGDAMLVAAAVQGAVWSAFLCYAFWIVRGQVILECLLVVAVAGITSTSASLYAPVPKAAYLQTAFQVIPACLWSVYAEPRYGWLLVTLIFTFVACAPLVIRIHARHTREVFQTQMTLEAQSAELYRQAAARDLAHAELAQAQHRLIEFSRYSGMAEIAAGVLHNVGNVLNSVNVSATLAEEKAETLRTEKLAASIEMLRSRQDDLGGFLAEDPKGRRLLPYLANLAGHFEQNRQGLLAELALLRGHIDHIRQIVTTQQNYAGVSGLIEPASLPQLVEDAFRIAQPGYERYSIELQRDFDDTPLVPVDRHRVLQILLNLFRNAQRSIEDSGSGRRAVMARIRRTTGDRVRIEISDTGVGIPAENLTRIFAHGFTTKHDGHGFGLHSGSLAAQKLGGSLWAESAGAGQGATFILELPASQSVQAVQSAAGA